MAESYYLCGVILANSSSSTKWMYCKRLRGRHVFLAANESETDGCAKTQGVTGHNHG